MFPLPPLQRRRERIVRSSHLHPRPHPARWHTFPLRPHHGHKVRNPRFQVSPRESGSVQGRRWCSANDGCWHRLRTGIGKKRITVHSRHSVESRNRFCESFTVALLVDEHSAIVEGTSRISCDVSSRGRVVITMPSTLLRHCDVKHPSPTDRRDFDVNIKLTRRFFIDWWWGCPV